MKYQPSVNPIQASIMTTLCLHSTQRFSEMNSTGVPSDQFSYHLRQLIKYNLVKKLPDSTYTLTVNGRSRAIMLDTRSNQFIEQGFIACRIVLSRVVDNETYYLVQHRTRVPYTGNIAEPGGKVLFGEDILQAAHRNMLVETGLSCDMKVKGLVHFKDQYQGRIVQDKFFFVIRATNPKGELLCRGATGENVWMDQNQISNNPKTHKGVLDIIAIAEGRGQEIRENTLTVDEY